MQKNGILWLISIAKNVYFCLITLFQQTQRLINYARNTVIDSYITII